MTEDTENIENYHRWNDALVEVLYPNIEVPIPVYLDLDDDVLAKAAQKVGYD